MKINGYENLNFVKWAGGKGYLINQIEQYLPRKIDRCFEPFVGGGATVKGSEMPSLRISHWL